MKDKLRDGRNYLQTTHLTKDSYLIHTKNSQNNKIIEMETGEWVSEVRIGGGEAGVCNYKEITRKDLCGDEIVLYLDCSGGYRSPHTG